MGQAETAGRRTQQQRREETRAKLIQAAIDIIRDQGAAHLTTAKVAKAAGMTRGAIQYHFENPKDMLREVIIVVVGFLSDQLEAENLSDMGKTARLSRVVDLYWHGYRSSTYEVFIEIAVHGRLDPEFGQIVADALKVLEKERDEQWLRLFADFPQSDQAKLEWRSHLLVILRGLALRQMFSETPEQVDGIYEYAKETYIADICRRAKLS